MENTSEINVKIPFSQHHVRILFHFCIIFNFQGMEYFRSLLVLLERTYKIKIDDYVAVDTPSTKALGLGGLALISAQKIFLFLGDLARYKETTEESCSYTNARQSVISLFTSQILQNIVNVLKIFVHFSDGTSRRTN